jgi:hypothetical protein
MIPIAMTLGAISPFAVAQRRIGRGFRLLGHLARFALGLVSAVVQFAVAIYAFTILSPPGALHAPLVYGVGLFIGTALAVPAVTLAAPDDRIELVLPWVSAAAILLPAGIFSQIAAAGGWHGAYLTYLAATFSGGVVGTNMTLRLAGLEHRATVGA